MTQKNSAPIIIVQLMFLLQTKKYCNLLLAKSRYARFTYIGSHSYRELDVKRAEEMYQAIASYFRRQPEGQHIFDQNMYFERVDTKACTEDFLHHGMVYPV